MSTSGSSAYRTAAVRQSGLTRRRVDKLNDLFATPQQTLTDRLDRIEYLQGSTEQSLQHIHKSNPFLQATPAQAIAKDGGHLYRQGAIQQACISDTIQQVACRAEHQNLRSRFWIAQPRCRKLPTRISNHAHPLLAVPHQDRRGGQARQSSKETHRGHAPPIL